MKKRLGIAHLKKYAVVCDECVVINPQTTYTSSAYTLQLLAKVKQKAVLKKPHPRLQFRFEILSRESSVSVGLNWKGEIRFYNHLL